MKHIFLFSLTICYFQSISQVSTTQTLTNGKNSTYIFKKQYNVETTEVQNQDKTSTCWSFSTLSFFESEVARKNKTLIPSLSEMYVVHKTYPLKAVNYIRMHGKNNFGAGGGFLDVLNVLRNYGMVPESVYTGRIKNKETHNHKNLESTLLSIVKSAAEDDNAIIDLEATKNIVEKACDEMLGTVPSSFSFNGKNYTPQSYAKEIGLVADDYVLITSFTHHPFYSKFILEVPDNWNFEPVYNVPLNDFKDIMQNALKNNYSIAWAADVSEKGFNFKEGLATLPNKAFSEFENKEEPFKNPQFQQVVTQEARQLAFDNYETQDDHGMHIVGLYTDQSNTNYYYVKNSWGKDKNDLSGYLFASESYVLMKTTNILVHKNAIPEAIAKKMFKN